MTVPRYRAVQTFQTSYIADMRSIEYSPSDEVWYVAQEERDADWQGYLQLFNDELPSLSAEDLRDALKAEAGTMEPADSRAYVVSVPRGYEDEGGPYEPVSFAWDGVTLTVVVEHRYRFEAENGDDGESQDGDGDEGRAVRRIRALLQPFIDDLASSRLDVEFEDWAGQDAVIEIRISAAAEGRTVADVFALGRDALTLCEGFSARAITRETVSHFVRGGAAHLLKGQEEGNWFDAKSMLYEATAAGAISLAQDVARFCNAEDGGLILIGAKTKKIPGGEIVSKVGGLEVPPGLAARYSGILNRYLYPLPAGLRIDVVTLPNERSVIAIDVPPQPDEQKPFLVHGAITADGDVEGAFISIVQRRGEVSVPITAPMIHAMLAAGRARMRAEDTRP